MSDKPTNTTYELASIHDVYRKLPANRIIDCMSELGILLAQGKTVEEDTIKLMTELGSPPTEDIFQLPASFTWIDDGNGKVELGFRNAADKDEVLATLTHDMKTNVTDVNQVAPPKPGRTILAIIEHCVSKNRRYATLDVVDEPDCTYRHDGAELSHDYNVVTWSYLPEL